MASELCAAASVIIAPGDCREMVLAGDRAGGTFCRTGLVFRLAAHVSGGRSTGSDTSDPCRAGPMT